MKPARFDPFSDRLSRDIRNDLSRDFVDAVKQREPLLFRHTANAYLGRSLASGYQEYVRDRLKRYEAVFASLEGRRSRDGFGPACMIWNGELFFEFHEYLESIWRESSGDTQQAIKGLIQAAAAYIHFHYGHTKAAEKLAKKAAALLKEHGQSILPFRNLSVLIEKLEKGDPVPPKL